MSLAVAAVAPFDLGHSLSFLRSFTPTRGEQTATSTRLTKALSCGGRAVVVKVRQKGDRDRPMLDVDLISEQRLDEGRWRDVLHRITHMLSADEDLGPFYARAAEDDAMAPLVQRLRGLHHVRFPSPFEAACWGVISQRTQMSTARAMKAGLVRRAGARLEVGDGDHWAFPEPDQVLALGEAELVRLLPGGRRAAAVLALARAFASVDASFLREAPIAQVRAWLRSIYGVGPFTSGFVLYRGLGRFDGATLISPKLIAAVRSLYRRPVDAREVARIAERYGAWGGYWMLYAWASTFPVTGGEASPAPGVRGHAPGLLARLM